MNADQLIHFIMANPVVSITSGLCLIVAFKFIAFKLIVNAIKNKENQETSLPLDE